MVAQGQIKPVVGRTLAMEEAPEAFGLMALVNAVLYGLRMFSDLGLGPSIIQKKGGVEPDFLHTAWTIQILRGAVLTIGACVLAWPMAAFYGEGTPLDPRQ